jgi:hypothetical protein
MVASKKVIGSDSETMTFMAAPRGNRPTLRVLSPLA